MSADGAGTRDVGAKIRDKDGGEREYTATVSVLNLAPVATFNAPASVNEGSPIALELTDPSSANTTGGFEFGFDCGDGGGFGAYSAAASVSCATTDDGSPRWVAASRTRISMPPRSRRRSTS